MPNEFIIKNGLISQGNITVTGSVTATSITISGSSAATLGSNTFIGTEIISGSLSISGSGTPFTLNTDVLEITGSLIVTGSSVVTGSLTVITGSLIEFQVTNTGVKVGNNITDTHTVTGSLSVSGSQTFIGTKTITGSVFITGSKTLIGTNTITGSMLISGSLTTTGTITATTLVVQTITSSISSITGSTNFGSLSSNTHTFTGSLNVTGALYVPTGSVGIGTNSPWGKFNVVAGTNLSLVVQDSGTADTIELVNYSNSGGVRAIALNGSVLSFGTGTAGGGSATSRIFITSGGYVGIGTTSNTSYQLRVSGANYGVLRGDAPSTPTLDLWQTGLENAAARNWRLVTNYEAWGTLDFQASTANNNGPSATRMTLDSSGNVGIGNGTPSFILDVNDTNASGVRGVRISSTSSTVGPGLFLYINSGANTNWAIGNSYEIGNALEFRSSNSVGGNPGTAGTTRMLITNTGNVVVGNAAYQGTTTDLSITGDKVNSNGYYSRLIFQNSNQSGGSSASIRAERVTSNFATELTFYTNPTTPAGEGFERLRIQANGAIRISNDAYFLCGSNGYRFNSSTDAFNNFIALDNGNATLRGTLTQNSSDERLKNNIQIIPNALNKISQLRGVTFEWNQELYETSRTTDIGVIAQDVQSVLPDAVTLAPFDTNFETNTSKSGENYLTVYYEKLIPLLIEGIKELTARVQELENK